MEEAIVTQELVVEEKELPHLDKVTITQELVTQAEIPLESVMRMNMKLTIGTKKIILYFSWKRLINGR
jgi:hypothetical protein